MLRIPIPSALTRYLGYHFRPWFEQNQTSHRTATTARGQRKAFAPPVAQPVSWATLYPNPTTSEVTVAYRLPAGTATAALTLYDHFGRPCRALRLTAPEGQVVLSLDGLPLGVYSYRIVAGEGQATQRGTLVKRP